MANRYNNRRIIKSGQKVAVGKLLPGMTARIAGGLGHGSDAPSDLNANSIMLVARNIPQDEFLPLATNQYQMNNLIRYLGGRVGYHPMNLK